MTIDIDIVLTTNRPTGGGGEANSLEVLVRGRTLVQTREFPSVVEAYANAIEQLVEQLEGDPE